MDIITKYFSKLTEAQIGQFTVLGDMYRDWNEKINVISRKDIDNIYLHHILHSLGIAKIINFASKSQIMDVGTGGGFPGIPLAIMFPECSFLLIDRVGKKIKVAADIAEKLGLRNVILKQCGVEEEKGTFDFIVSRATMSLPDLLKLCRKNVAIHQQNALPNGVIALKGGELQNEIATVKRIAVTYELSSFFDEEYFSTKKGIYVPIIKK
ncbi:MAG: 16S rRNA (guanine(527)-N(7))-methyltransferase RsmG [Bacteroidales bacterium]